MPLILAPIPPDIATGFYASQTDVEDLFTPVNVAHWSQYSSTATTTDTTRVARALAYAEDQINGTMRGGPYEIPLSCGCANATVRYWAAVIAGVWLFTSANPLQVTTTVNVAGVVGTVTTAQANALLTAVQQDMQLYKAGAKVLNACLVTLAAPTAATPVSD